MFKFNFSNPDESADKSSQTEPHSQDKHDSIEWFPAREIFPPPSPCTVQDALVFVCRTYLLWHIPAEKVLKELSNTASDEGITEAEINHCDIVPAKYEGGMKVWECTSDLADFLLRHNVHFRGQRVLDLGCGTGLLGILAMYLRATAVHFQDYNESVIESTTIINVSLNVAGNMATNRYFAGDWQSFADLFNKESMERYNCILTSETIYNPDNHRKLLNIFKTCLLPDGVIYLAAKTYYFGVGGGTRQFETMLAKDGTFHSEVCWKCYDGVQREILRITFHKSHKTDV